MPVVTQRLMQLVPVVLGVSIITFLLLNLLPGDVAVAILGTNATSQGLAQLRQQLGLNQALPVRYWHWLVQAVQGNLGQSLTTHQSVASLLGERVPVTIELIVLAILIALLLAVPVAILAAWRPGGIFDRVAGLIGMAGLSLPNFVVAIILILLLAVHGRLLPATGFTPLGHGLGANLRTVIIPALSMSFLLFATYMRMLRADMLEQMDSEDYVVTAEAKGVPTGGILVRHVLRNSLFGLITVVAVNFGTLIGASVIIESLFGLPGVGQLLISSIYNRDVTVVQGVVLVMAVVVVVMNLFADVLYAVLDPRVRHGS